MKKNEKKKLTTPQIVAIVLGSVVLLVFLIAIILFILFARIWGLTEDGNLDTTVSQEQATILEQLDGIIMMPDPETGETVPMVTDPDTGEWVPTEPVPDDSVIDAEDIYFPEGWEMPDMEDQGKDIVNIMVVGQDARPGEPAQRSDSMILVTFNRKTKQIYLTSFLRDQYVQIPGYGNTKLCHAYSYGGMTLMNQTIQNHYGIEIDGNVTFSFEGFKEIIDMLGGVEINLTWDEASALNNLESKKEWRLKPGVQVLTGEQALRYARLRHIDSDFQRTERQRKVIMSVIEAYKNCKLSDMMKILEKTMPLITTNISTGQMFTYVIQLFPMISGAQMKTQQLPAAGTFTSGLIKVSENYMASCQYNIDFAANREALNKIFDDIP